MRHWWPDAADERLLRAVLIPGCGDGMAPERVLALLGARRPGRGVYRLMPLVYRRVAAAGLEGPVVEALRRLYLATSYHNRVLIERGSRVLRALADANIETMILKGAALVSAHYRDPGLRPMGDVDVLVPAREGPRATAVLERCGWRPAPGLDAGRTRIKHAWPFSDPDGHECDLHWRAYADSDRPDDDLWRSSRAADLGGVPTRVLAPADELLHVCAHAALRRPEPNYYWIADALAVLRDGGIEWACLIDQALTRRLVLRTRQMLGCLSTRMDAPVPAEVLEALGRLPVSRVERLEDRVLRLDPEVWGTLPVQWCRYRRATGGGPARSLTFSAYLRHAWGVPARRRVLSHALRRFPRRAGRLLARRPRR